MSTESRRKANIENAKRRQAAAPATNSDVQPGSTTTGRAGAAERTQEESSTINLVIYTPPATAGSTTAGILRYPADPEITEDSDYVVFSFFKYAPPFGGGENTPNSAAATAQPRSLCGCSDNTMLERSLIVRPNHSITSPYTLGE